MEFEKRHVSSGPDLLDVRVGGIAPARKVFRSESVVETRPLGSRSRDMAQSAFGEDVEVRRHHGNIGQYSEEYVPERLQLGDADAIQVMLGDCEILANKPQLPHSKRDRKADKPCCIAECRLIGAFKFGEIFFRLAVGPGLPGCPPCDDPIDEPLAGHTVNVGSAVEEPIRKGDARDRRKARPEDDRDWTRPAVTHKLSQ